MSKTERLLSGDDVKQIDSLSDEPKQTTQIMLDDGSFVSLAVRYLPRPQVWMADVSWGNFSLNNFVLRCHPNLLRQWRHVIPFGIAILAEGDLDPFMVDDFKVGRVGFFLLNSDDIETVETEVIGAAS